LKKNFFFNKKMIKNMNFILDVLTEEKEQGTDSLNITVLDDGNF
jgi:hypothetical protein